MLRTSCLAPLAALLFVLLPAPAAANDDAFELWLNPSASVALDDDTGLEIETAQRLRNAVDGREDTYFARFWINQDLSDQVTLSAAAEQRVNDPGREERRLIQQISTRHGLLRTRLRLEQRFVEDRRMGIRVRPRLGVSVPLAENGRWSFLTDAELFLTLRSSSAGGDTGVTGLRTRIGAGHKLSDTISVTLAYLRQQAFEDGGPDQVGHAPLIGIELSF